MAKVKKFIMWLLGGSFISYILHFPFKLAEDALSGWILRHIEEKWAMVVSVLISWIIPITLAGGILYVAFIVWRSTGKDKVSEMEIAMTEDSNKESFSRDIPTVIKDAKVKLDVENADEVTGMSIDNVPTELSNVQIDVKAKGVGSATGLNVTAYNKEFALSQTTILCSCGNTFCSTTTCGYKPVIKCPKCGKEYRD